MNLDVWLSDPSAQFLSDKAAQAWETAWTKFFLPKTGLFYDYLGSYVPGRELAHLLAAWWRLQEGRAGAMGGSPGSFRGG